jgi:hypothetical protein
VAASGSLATPLLLLLLLLLLPAAKPCAAWKSRRCGRSADSCSMYQPKKLSWKVHVIRAEKER